MVLGFFLPSLLLASKSFLSPRSFLKVINKPSLILIGRALTSLLYQLTIFIKPLSTSISVALEYQQVCLVQEAVKYLRTKIVSYSGCTLSVRKCLLENPMTNTHCLQICIPRFCFIFSKPHSLSSFFQTSHLHLSDSRRVLPEGPETQLTFHKFKF